MDIKAAGYIPGRDGAAHGLRQAAGDGKANASVGFAGRFYCVVSVKKAPHLNLVKTWGRIGKNNLSVIGHSNVEIAAAVFNGVAENVGKYPGQGVFIETAFYPD